MRWIVGVFSALVVFALAAPAFAQNCSQAPPEPVRASAVNNAAQPLTTAPQTLTSAVTGGGGCANGQCNLAARPGAPGSVLSTLAAVDLHDPAAKAGDYSIDRASAMAFVRGVDVSRPAAEPGTMVANSETSSRSRSRNVSYTFGRFVRR